MINDQGGINGRKITLIALDDGYSPPKTMEVVRNLIEEEQVAFLFQTIGTAPNAAIRKYVNPKKVPDIWLGFRRVGCSLPHTVWPKRDIPFQPSYRLEGQMLGQYILKEKPDAKIGATRQQRPRRCPTSAARRASSNCAAHIWTVSRSAPTASSSSRRCPRANSC